MNYIFILHNFLFVNNYILSYLFIYPFIYSFFVCPQLVMKTKYIDTLIELLLYYLLTQSLTMREHLPLVIFETPILLSNLDQITMNFVQWLK